MENLAMKEFWKNKRVLVTGHTGFKGGWLTLWLVKMGAQVTGISLEPSSAPNFFEIVNFKDLINHVIADIRDKDSVKNIMTVAQPDVIFHLAAQPLVRYSYKYPVETYETNVMGTVNVLEAIKAVPSIKVAVIVTSDKCYANSEQLWSYREHDKLGGHDPYSSSKACAEIITQAYAYSYFIRNMGRGILASARAGNVVGGGDWGEDRLIPDLVRALMENKNPVLRNPHSIRPWQHVLEPLSGYLKIVETLYGKMQIEPLNYNFGPEAEGEIDVATLAESFCNKWGNVYKPIIEMDQNNPHEANLLTLDITKAKKKLTWKPKWTIQETISETVAWYIAYEEKKDMLGFSLAQIDRYNTQLT